MPSFPFAGDVNQNESSVLSVSAAEGMRQWRQLIMIASESICHPEAVALISKDLGHIYAEGRPQPLLCHDPRDSAADQVRFESWQTRLADRRFYKGTIGANRVELLAQAYIAEVFSRLEGSPAAQSIFVNVQPLSGAAANLVVFNALLEHGDRILGLDLAHGGHLTHGSQFNFSGKTYEAHAYGIDETTRRLDYDCVRAKALEVRPKMIIGGASSYPWDFDWAALSAIAKEVNATLLADVSHLAGLIAAGLLSNPLPYADVAMFTTHKTLCGPRGAVILSTNPEIAKRIDGAVFPGMQGGPHMNSIAAIARLFELILQDGDGFRAFQQRVLDNTSFFGACLQEQGFTLEYGGTNTHMVLVDLKPFPVKGEMFLDGEIASRLLEIGGIVCNKNVLPGDPDGAHASGLRFGLPWLTQRGVTQDQLADIAKVARDVLGRVKTVTIWSPLGDKRCRGRIPPGVLETAAQETLAIAEALPYPQQPDMPEPARLNPTLGDRAIFTMSGDKVDLALEQMLTARLPLDHTPVCVGMLRADGTIIDNVVVQRLASQGRSQRWRILPHGTCAAEVRRWIENLSDGYLLFDDSDLQQKIDGPSVLQETDLDSLTPEERERLQAVSAPLPDDLTKPYFIGQRALYRNATLLAKPEYEYQAEEIPLRKTVLNRIHHDLRAKMAPFAGWEMPIEYPSGILAEHRAVRTAAGLFDVSHMAAFEVSGPKALHFLDVVTANCVSRLDPGEAQYSSLLRPNGTAIDDIYLYRLAWDRFMMVANAANAERVADWLETVNSHTISIDEEMPAKETDGPVSIRNLRDAGEASRVGLALQGPLSLRILQQLASNQAERFALKTLVTNSVVNVRLADSEVMVARTGYTGEALGFELYVHPDQAGDLWAAMLEVGTPLGALPAGLGARDSTRVEAGFPLFGHELEGDLGISMTEAGYGFITRFHVPFFIGRRPYMERAATSRRHLLRLQGRGRKTLRPGHVILSKDGRAVGEVTSFAYVHEDMTFIALACVEEDFSPEPGQNILGARIRAEKLDGVPEERSLVELVVLSRFPEDAERDAWPVRCRLGMV